MAGACNPLAEPGGGVVRDAGQLRGTAAVDCDVKKPAGWPPSAGAAETACAAAETACAAAEAENVKLRRDLASCLCHGLPVELPLWLAALPRTCRILGAEPLSRSFLI